MSHRHLLPLLALLIPPLACKKSSDGTEASPAEQAAQVSKICDSMNDLSLAYVAGLTEIEVDSLQTPGKRDELRKACHALPLEVAQCADRLALDDPKCDAALERFLGMTDTTPQGQGPAPAWALTAPFEIFDLDVTDDGRVAIADDRHVAVVDDGKVSWSVEVTDGDALVLWWKDQVLTGTGTSLRAYGADGSEAWSREVAPAGEWLSTIEAAPAGHVIVVTSGGKILRANPEACAAGGEGCTEAIGTVEAIGGMMVEVLPSGALVGSSDRGIALVSAKGELLAQRKADYDTSTPSGGLLVAGKDVLRADPECAKDSESCFTTLHSGGEMLLVAPLQLDGIGVIHTDSYGVIASVGDKPWKIDAGNDGDLRTDGTTIYSVGHQLGFDAMDAPPQLRAIEAATGRTQWITPLGRERAGLLSGYIVVLRAGHVFVATKAQLFAVPVGG